MYILVAFLKNYDSMLLVNLSHTIRLLSCFITDISLILHDSLFHRHFTPFKSIRILFLRKEKRIRKKANGSLAQSSRTAGSLSLIPRFCVYEILLHNAKISLHRTHTFSLFTAENWRLLDCYEGRLLRWLKVCSRLFNIHA